MVDRLVHQSRRLRGLSLASVESSSRRCRTNSSGDFQSMAVNAMKIDPLVQAIDSWNRPGISRDLERNIPVLSKVLFQSEDVIEVEELHDSPLNTSSPLPPDYLDVLLYVGTPTNRPSSPGH